MNKWTWVAVFAFVAVLGGSYYLLSQGKGKTDSEEVSRDHEGEMDVDDFDTSDDAAVDDKGDNTYDMLEDPDAPAGAPDSGTAGGAEIDAVDGDGSGVDAGTAPATGDIPPPSGVAPPATPKHTP